MAKNLAQNGPEHVKDLPPVRVWNRTRSKAEKLLELVGADKASIAESPEEIALKCDIIVVNLASDDVVRKIYTRFSDALRVRLAEPPLLSSVLICSLPGSPPRQEQNLRRNQHSMWFVHTFQQRSHALLDIPLPGWRARPAAFIVPSHPPDHLPCSWEPSRCRQVPVVAHHERRLPIEEGSRQSICACRGKEGHRPGRRSREG